VATPAIATRHAVAVATDTGAQLQVLEQRRRDRSTPTCEMETPKTEEAIVRINFLGLIVGEEVAKVQMPRASNPYEWKECILHHVDGTIHTRETHTYANAT
jgi:hypothetical protein